MKHIIYVAALSSLILCASCSSSSKTTELEGTWKYCNPNYNELNTFIFTGNDYETITETYSNSDCTGTLTANTIDYKGQFSIGREFITPSDLPAKELDLVEDNGDLYYDIFSVQNTDSGEILYFGDTTTIDGRTPATRPTDLDYGFAFIKQN